MKITKSKLKRIITEELQNILSEVDDTVILDPVEMAAKRQADREARAAERAKKARLERRALRLMKILYPDDTKEEVLGIIEDKKSDADEESKIADILFSFLFPDFFYAPKPADLNLLKVAEDWVNSKGVDNAFIRRKNEEGTDELNKDNLDDLYRVIDADIDARNWSAQRAGAASFKPSSTARPARNVPVPQSATPGTPAYDALDAIMRDLGTQLKRR
jgi:hypothetical protein